MATVLFASWTHGCSAVCENDGSLTEVLYRGFGVTFTKPAGGADWIHIPIPTPVFVQGQRSRVWKVFCLFNAAEGAKVSSFGVYDGPVDIGSRQTSISGDHSWTIDLETVPEDKRNW